MRNVHNNFNAALDQLESFLREVEAQVGTFQQTQTNTPARFGDPHFEFWLEYAKKRSSGNMFVLSSRHTVPVFIAPS